MDGEPRSVDNADQLADPERRAALAKIGKYAGVTAPAVVALLTADASEAWAASGRGRGRNGPKGPKSPNGPWKPGRPRRPSR